MSGAWQLRNQPEAQASQAHIRRRMGLAPLNGGLLDPAFMYVPAEHTDIRKTFARAREFYAEWEHSERLPRFDDLREFEVWINGNIRAVRRVGNGSDFFTPGTLIYTDCSSPYQNVICEESQVNAWRYARTQMKDGKHGPP